MVEGGSTILSSFVQQDGLVDCFCLTIAAKILGSQGLPAFVPHHHYHSPAKRTCSGHVNKIGLLELRDVQWVPMGNDSILLARRANKTTLDGIEKR
jgi:riboflavin biosynthesis pyrimidine reductase